MARTDPHLQPRSRHPAARRSRAAPPARGTSLDVARSQRDPALRAVVAARWGVLILGLSTTSASSVPSPITYGIATSLLVFNASWRTLRPASGPVPAATDRRAVARTIAPELVVAVLAAALSGGASGPYGLAALPAVLLAGYFGGMGAALTTVAVDLVALLGLDLLGVEDGAGSPATVVAVLVVVAMLSAASGRQQRSTTDAPDSSDLRLLNRLLTSMHRLTRTSNVSLDLDDVLAATRDRIRAAFDPSTLAIASYGIAGARWRVELVDDEHARDLDHDAVHALANLAAQHGGALVDEQQLAGLGASGLCQVLRADDSVVGALIVAHDAPGTYDAEDLGVLRSLAEPVALAIDNARWFRRIRTVAADEERVRIARELHDGVAQSLVAVHLDLGRIEQAPPEVQRARVQVEGALLSLRDSLIDLRAGVTASTPLSTLAKEATDRLQSRTSVECHLDVVEEGPHLPPRIEHEVWRVLQEALANVEQHAEATVAMVRWYLDDQVASLDVLDDGVGFHPTSPGHGTFGLQGMLERADAIDASLRIESTPGQGTAVQLRLAR